MSHDDDDYEVFLINSLTIISLGAYMYVLSTRFDCERQKLGENIIIYLKQLGKLLRRQNVLFSQAFTISIATRLVQPFASSLCVDVY